MKFKKSLLIIALIICLFAMASVSAADANDTAMTTTEDSLVIDQATDDVIGMEEDKELASSGTNEVLKADEQTFSQLNATINGNTDNDIYLTSDYKYSSGDDSFKEGIVIDRDVNIYGNGHTINGSGEARIFQVSGGNVVFYNITFVNGNTTGDGGAINGECRAINCTFKENQAFCGGAMNLGTAVDCTFIGNHADESSGGAMCGGSAVNCTFTGNSAFGGGAMCGGSAVNCTFTQNTAGLDGGAMLWVSAVNCTFTQNTAGEDGGAMMGGSAVNCTFTKNNAGEGGGAMYGGSAVNCTFTQNQAISGGGGAIRSGSAVNCTFTQNTAGRDGGAMDSCKYLLCSGQENEYRICDELDLYFDVSDFTSTYNSNELFFITLYGQLDVIDFINTDVVIYKDGVEVRRYSCLSGDSVIFDLAAGNYTVNLTTTYPNLNPTSKTIKLTINKAKPKIEVIANESTYPNVVVNVKTDVSGVYMVKVGDKIQNVTLEANVAKDITFMGLAVNEMGYTVNVTNNDVENCTKVVNDTAKAIVHKATPKIEVIANESTYPNVVVNVKTDVSGVYMVKVGDKIQNVTLEANVAKDITFMGLAVNEMGYTVNVTNNDVENCTKVVNDTAKAIVHKATPTINVSAVDVTYPSAVVVTVKSDVNGTYIVKVGDKLQNVTLEANVTKNITFTGLAANEGGYVVNVTHDSENYTGFNDTAKAIVHKATPTINVSAVDVTYPSAVVVTVKSDVNGSYIVKVGDKSQNVTLEANVTQNITFTGLSANEAGYAINVTHDSENYTGFNDAAIVKVMKGAVKLIADAVTATYNVNKNLVITLKDANGKALNGVKVTVNLNGAKTYTTDKNGQIKINVAKLVPKTYTAKVTFNGNTNYLKSTADVKVTVKKAKPKIIAKKKTYKAKKKVKKFTITLKDNKGKPIKKAKVTMKVIKIKKTSKKKSKKTGKKSILKAKTNKKGKATFKINRNKKGKYQVIIKYKGNKYYNKMTKKIKIKIK